SEDNVKSLLQTEYKLLCMVNCIKKHFDQWVQECHVTKIPKFSFNFNQSIFGYLHNLRESSGGHLPYKHFIVTPLLPCNKLNAGIQKFTGNNDIAIHAFTHFSLIYTKHTHLFCDLQGLYDHNRNMCLIDPQCHT
ncbi:hypothetical protein PILCRDRAFT_69005, partial [Piloderma croceum F 1598]